MKALDCVVMILLIVGGLNWLLVGLFNLDIVTAIFGVFLARIVFIIVGACAIYSCKFLPSLWSKLKSSSNI